MRKNVIFWATIVLISCCLAYGDTPGWDPGNPIVGYICVDTPRGQCQAEPHVPCWINPPECPPGSYHLEPVPIYSGEQVTFRGIAYDIDNQGDPIAYDGVHCVWSYRPVSGGDWIEMGKSKANALCPDEEYGTQGLAFSFRFPGEYTVKCVMDDCHIWANDPDSKEYTLWIKVDYNPSLSHS